MGDERIDSGAEAATRGDADPGQGQGLATPGAHPGGFTGGATEDPGDQPVPDDERKDSVEESAPGQTEGERSVRAAAENRRTDAAPGSSDPTTHGGSGSASDSDLAHPLG